jgi:hypothetical protein
MKRNTWGRVLALAVFAALLFAATHTAFAAKGGKRTTATIGFDDYLDDAIQSDGLGAYDGFISSRDGSAVFTTGDRVLSFDFGWGAGPVEVSDVTITVSSLDGTTATADFEFSWPSPYDTAATDWLVTMSVSVTQSGDTYSLEFTSDAEVWWLDRHRQSYGLGHRFGPVWELEGITEMQWGAEVS